MSRSPFTAHWWMCWQDAHGQILEALLSILGRSRITPGIGPEHIFFISMKSSAGNLCACDRPRSPRSLSIAFESRRNHSSSESVQHRLCGGSWPWNKPGKIWRSFVYQTWGQRCGTSRKARQVEQERGEMGKRPLTEHYKSQKDQQRRRIFVPYIKGRRSWKGLAGGLQETIQFLEELASQPLKLVLFLRSGGRWPQIEEAEGCV